MPTTIAKKIDGKSPNSYVVIDSAAIPPANPRTDPTERSMFPETITISIPTASIAVNDICVARLERLVGVRNIEPVAQWKYSQINASTPIITYARNEDVEIFDSFVSLIE